ncbi:MAG: hypothetical protein HUK21_11280 [Fibrobacteraceae bacterium]|nr:hypothetical protein [Fibrobacteraceae bacterium]
MSPLKTLISIISLFAVLGFIALVFPHSGIAVGSKTLRYPSLADVFPKANVDTNDVDPEKAMQELVEATRRKEFSAFSDSLKYYEDFFTQGRTRFDLPDDDPTWFDRFFLNLELAELDSTVVHIVHYGDSQLEEDRISATIREDLQSEFGGAGPGMMPPIMGVPSQTTSHWNSGALSRYILFGPKDEEADHNRYGPLAQFADLNGEAMIGFKKREQNRNDKFPHVGNYTTIKVLSGKRGSLRLKLVYDSTVVEYKQTANAETGEVKIVEKSRKKKSVEAPAPIIDKLKKLNVYTWKLPDTTSSAKIYLSGNTEIYAVSADGPYGVAVDNVAMRGSSGTIFHRIDNELLAEAYKAMNAKLIIMEYGGNLVPSTSRSNIEWTKKIISRQIQTIQKANPSADILFIGPADMAKQIDGEYKTYPSLNLTIKALREVALENGAAYWDMHRVMGGNGAMIKWVNKQPALGFTDHIHFTRRGAAYMGELFCNSLRMHYDFFKFRDRHKIDDAKLKEIMHYADSLQQVKLLKTQKPKKKSVKKKKAAPSKGGRK